MDGRIADWRENFIVTNSQVSHPILEKAARLKIIGKVSRRLLSAAESVDLGAAPFSCAQSVSSPFLRGVVARFGLPAGQAPKYFGTFFLRNRPALELMCRLARQKAQGSTLRIAVLGCSIGAEVYSNPLDHPLGPAGLEGAP